jgi:flavin-dependent dehydrogenase
METFDPLKNIIPINRGKLILLSDFEKAMKENDAWYEEQWKDREAGRDRKEAEQIAALTEALEKLISLGKSVIQDRENGKYMNITPQYMINIAQDALKQRRMAAKAAE